MEIASEVSTCLWVRMLAVSVEVLKFVGIGPKMFKKLVILCETFLSNFPGAIKYWHVDGVVTGTLALTARLRR